MMAMASAPAPKRMLMIGSTIIVKNVRRLIFLQKGILEQLIPTFPDIDGHALKGKNSTGGEETKNR